MIPLLEPDMPFPPVGEALADPNGLLAASVELAPQRLLDAYRRGIFPWYSAGEPVLWWSPDPRMILVPAELHVGRSLGKTLRRVAEGEPWTLRLDTAFEPVMRACAAPRPGRHGTWITPAIIAAYCELHRHGFAHSVEVWQGDRLVGGLYGVAIGRMFFGESMFSRVADASKVALAALVRILLREQVPVLDCQQSTRHLASLGAREVARDDFCRHVHAAVARTPVAWQLYRDQALNRLLADG
jgi:leucyl/phenylalanyl-tRNA--protein transferase